MLTLNDPALQAMTIIIAAIIAFLFFFGLHQTMWAEQWHRYRSYAVGVGTIFIGFAIVAIIAAANGDNPSPLFWLCLLCVLISFAGLGAITAEVRQVVKDARGTTERLNGLDHLE